MNKKEIVSANIFQPHNALFKAHRKGSAEVKLIHCENSSKCQLYKKGQCALLGVFGGSPCSYGHMTYEEGPTPRAKKYYSWLSEKQKQYEGTKRLGQASDVIAIVGYYVYLPYAHINMNTKVLFWGGHGGFARSGGTMVLQKDFTVDMINEIVKFRPEALFGGEISSYRLEIVPKFLKHLSEHMLEKFNEFVAKYPEYEKFRNTTNVGRKAILSTVNSNVGKFKDIHGGLWSWDGEYLISTNSKISFALINGFSEVKIKPSGKSVVIITEDAQVNTTTEFVD